MMLRDLFEPVQLGVLPGKPYLHGAADTRPCGHPSLHGRTGTGFKRGLGRDKRGDL